MRIVGDMKVCPGILVAYFFPPPFPSCVSVFKSAALAYRRASLDKWRWG